MPQRQTIHDPFNASLSAGVDPAAVAQGTGVSQHAPLAPTTRCLPGEMPDVVSLVAASHRIVSPANAAAHATFFKSHNHNSGDI